MKTFSAGYDSFCFCWLMAQMSLTCFSRIWSISLLPTLHGGGERIVKNSECLAFEHFILQFSCVNCVPAFCCILLASGMLSYVVFWYQWNWHIWENIFWKEDNKENFSGKTKLSTINDAAGKVEKEKSISSIYIEHRKWEFKQISFLATWNLL